MALDGIFLFALRDEIAAKAVDSRVDKVFQPSRYEIHLVLRNRNISFRLCLSAAADAPRVHFTENKPENPISAPMFCMLLRKHLQGGRLLRVTQPSLERALTFDFECLNEFGDTVLKRLIIEVMGKHSNILLTDADGRIADAIRRVDWNMSSCRQVLPGLAYNPPPSQDKLSILEYEPDGILALIMQNGVQRLDRSILSALQGMSPVQARELCHSCCGHTEPDAGDLTEKEWESLKDAIGELKRRVMARDFAPAIYREKGTGKAIEFSCLPLFQYGTLVYPEYFSSPSELIEKYYFSKARHEALRQRTDDTRRLVERAAGRLTRKLAAQRAELSQCAAKDDSRLFGDLITANIHRIRRGDAFLIAEDFSGAGGPKIKIPLKPDLTPAANAQRHYKKYTKAKNAEKALQKLITEGQDELLYLESVLNNIEKAQSADELSGIREELSKAGYVKKPAKKRRQKPLPLNARSFISSDGFTISVGRNNLQNDALTFKTARKQDIWLHVKDMAGSHVIISVKGENVPPRTLTEAAQLAAYYSRASISENIPVDYTAVKNVRKIPGSRPGMVIYEGQRTLFVTPKGLPPDMQPSHTAADLRK